MRRVFLQGRRTAAFFHPSVLIVLACALAMAATACHRANQAADLRVLTHLQPQPPRVGQATVTIAITDAHASPVAGASIQVEGDMAHPGMAPVFGEAKETAPR